MQSITEWNPWTATVRLRLWDTGRDDVYVEVRDNGLGMPDEMVDALTTENNRVRKHGSGVGLINVHNRIRLRFGEPYGLEIESCLDEGTTVRIHLPCIAYSPENTELLEEED